MNSMHNKIIKNYKFFLFIGIVYILWNCFFIFYQWLALSHNTYLIKKE